MPSPPGPKRLRGLPSLGGRECDQLDVDDCLRDAFDVTVLSPADELALDASIAQAAAAVRAVRPAPRPRATSPGIRQYFTSDLAAG